MQIIVFSFQKDMVGAFFSLDGLLGLELFDKSITFEPVFPGILEAYSIEAIEDQSVSDFKAIEMNEIFQKLATDDWLKNKSCGLGENWRREEGRFTASALVVEDACIHLHAYLGRADF